MSKAATEAQVGFLHALVTELHLRRLNRMIHQMDEDGVSPEFAIDDKYMRVVQKWVLDNGVTATPDVADGRSPLAGRVDKIKERMKGNVINFRDEAREKGKA